MSRDDEIKIEEYKEASSPSRNYQDVDDMSEEEKKMIQEVGLSTEEKKAKGLYVQRDNTSDLCISKVKDIEIMPIHDAFEKYDGTDGKMDLKDYLWKAVPKDKDKYTVEASIKKITQGYFIYAKKGAKSIFPMQSCLFIDLPGVKQVVHNIIIAEEGAQLDIITGCTVHKGVDKALHIGVSEFYAKKDAKISFSMIHNWSKQSYVRPRTGVILEENAQFTNYYIIMSHLKDLQTNPTVYLNGKNSSYYGQTLIYAKGDGIFDAGATCYLNGEGSNAEILSRVISLDEAHILARGKIVGNAADSTGHIDCSGLLLSDKGRVDSIPEIDAVNPNVSLTHEASVGKIASEHIEYLTSRGLSEDEAVDLIIKGFLQADTSHLPEELAKETDKIVEMATSAEMG